MYLSLMSHKLSNGRFELGGPTRMGEKCPHVDIDQFIFLDTLICIHYILLLNTIMFIVYPRWLIIEIQLFKCLIFKSSYNSG